MKKEEKKLQKESLLNRMFMSAFATAIISSASQLGASFLDGFITSKGLGATALAAVGIAAPCFNIVGFFSACISNGMRAMCTREMGEGRIEKVNRIFSEAVLIATLLSVVIMVLMFIFTGEFARLLGATEDAASLEGTVSEYIKGFAVGVPPLMLTVIFSTALQIDDGGNLVKKASYVSLGVNFAGDIIAVICGFGVMGIAFATAFSCYASAGCMCIHIFSKKTKLKFVLTGPVKADVSEMIRLGSDKLVNSAINTLRPVIFNRMVIFYGGSVAMTVLTARNNLSGLCEIASGGVGIAVAITIGFLFGEKNREDIRRIGRKAQGLALGIMIPVGAALILFAAPLAAFYMNGEGRDAIALLAFAIACLGIRMPLGTFNYAYLQYLQTTHQMRSARRMTVFLNFVYILLAGFVLGHFFGAYGIMAAFPVTDGAMLLTIYLKCCIKTRSLRPAADAYLGLSEDQIIPSEDVLESTIVGEEDRKCIVDETGKFLEEHGVGKENIEKIIYMINKAFDKIHRLAEEYGIRKVRIDLRETFTSKGDVTIRMRYQDSIGSVEAPETDDAEVTLINTLGTGNIAFRYVMESNAGGQ